MYKLLSHNDLDGVGCGILAKLAFNDQVKIRYNSVTALDREIEFFWKMNSPKLFYLLQIFLRMRGTKKGLMITFRLLGMCNF